MLVASLVAASMDPLARLGRAPARPADVPSVVNTFVLFMPNYACAVVAMLPSHVLQRLGRRLREAQELGSYHLVELLGRGGMGEVWRGAAIGCWRASAAIKLVRPEAARRRAATPRRASMLRRFEREAQATAALSSPHTIRVFDFGVTDDGTFYYVMELLAGRDLESLVREFGPLPADRALFLLRQVCHSLADAHARGLVHRDIKPANIYVCRMGLDYDFVKVLDFGLVKFNDQRSIEQTLMTGAHTTTGTPAFMAPEIILGGRGRPARRRLRARLRGLLPADRPAGVRGRHADEDVRAAPADAADPAVAAHRAADSARARRARAGLPREGSRASGRRTPSSCFEMLRADVPTPREAWDNDARQRAGGRRICSELTGPLDAEPPTALATSASAQPPLASTAGFSPRLARYRA